MITIKQSERLFDLASQLQTAAAALAANREQLDQLEIVCCWCKPHHVIRVGAQPTSHGACPLGLATFESEVRR